MGIKCLAHKCPVGDELDAYKTLRQYDKIMLHAAKHCLDCRCNASNNPPPEPVPLSFWIKCIIPLMCIIGLYVTTMFGYKWLALPFMIIMIWSIYYLRKDL